MTDFLLWILVIALACAKLVLFAVLIELGWVLIKKYSPSTAKYFEDKAPRFKKEESK